MAKYHPLEKHLDHLTQDRWKASFAEIEALLGSPLPASARRWRPWWANDDRGGRQSYAWLRAGFVTANVDMAGETVEFVRS